MAIDRASAPILLTRLADTNGDGTGTTNAVGDYSSTATSFKVVPPAGQIFTLHRVLVYIIDNGAFDVDKYANGVTLTNGIRAYMRDTNDAIISEVTGFPIKTSGDWAGHCFDITNHTFGTGNDILIVRWTFSRHGYPLVLNGDQGEWLDIVLNDDFSTIVGHRFLLEGYIIGANDFPQFDIIPGSLN